MIRRPLIALSAVLVLAGCSQPAPAPAPSEAPASSAPATTPATTAETTAPAAATATDLAKQIQTKVSTVTKVVTITEDNDPNDLLGRPTGYTEAAILYDSRAECSELGTDCGATIEIWPTEADAQARADYIAKIQKASPMLGAEYHTVKGTALLRVTGEIKPSQAKAFDAAFSS